MKDVMNLFIMFFSVIVGHAEVAKILEEAAEDQLTENESQ